MRKGKLKSGFSFEFDETRLDDMNFVDELAEIVDESVPDFRRLIATSKIVTLMLGAEQKKALYEHIAKQNDGRVPISVMQDVLQEIMTADGENTPKN